MIVSTFFCPSRSRPELLSDPTPSHINGEPNSVGARGDYVGNAGTDPDSGAAFGTDTNGVIVGQLILTPSSDFKRDSKYRFKNVTDGLSKTILAGEKHVQYGKFTSVPTEGDGCIYNGNERFYAMRYGGTLYPLAFGGEDTICCFNFGSWHPGICQFVMLDGSVHALDTAIPGDLLDRLAKRNDGKSIEQF